MVRAAKPYQRSDSYRKGNPDAPGGWKHDLHENVKASLASRLSSSTSSSTNNRPRTSGGSLLSRIAGGQGKELLPTGEGSNVKLYGFDGPAPSNPNNLNAGLELLPTSSPTTARANSGMKSGPVGGRLVDRSGLNAALSRNGQSHGQRRTQPRELISSQQQPQSYTQPQAYQQPQQHVSIMGAARAATWVRVDNLAAGTTAEDVLSAFAHLPILNAKVSSPPSASNVAVEIELETRAAAEELIKQYNGIVADGNTLKVSFVSQSLRDRLGGGASAGRNGAAAVAGTGSEPSAAGRELLGAPSSGKLYSDTILSSNTSSAATTLAAGTSADHSRARSDAWMRGAPSLADRLGGGSSHGRNRGRGQIGGGSFHDMLVD